MGAQTTADETISPTPARIRLDYLDGIRGIAALWVVLEHLATELVTRTDAGQMPHILLCALYQIMVGPVPVDVFIVLSGYCLMLPVARTGELSGGFRAYILRRARRILPPYYASLVLFALLLLLVPALRYGFGTHYTEHVPFLTVPIVVSHLLMVHNVSHAWIYQGNGVWWSVATEWQIYFTMPLLIWAWRKRGAGAAIALGFAIGLLPTLLKLGVDGACYHFVGLFALGMAAAAVSFAPGASEATRRKPWAAISAISCVASMYAVHGTVDIAYVPLNILQDTLVGITTASTLVWLTESLRTGRTPWALTLASSKAALSLGAFSYSLYLCHYPLQLLCEAQLMRYHVAIMPSLAFMVGVGLPFSIAGSYVFYHFFEKPFTTGGGSGERAKLEARLPEPRHVALAE